MSKTTTKPKAPKRWRATVNLDRLDAASGRWRITTSSAKDPLPRAVATDPGVVAAIGAWMSAHGGKVQPASEASEQLRQAIRDNVTSAFRALPPGEATAPAAPR